jgi:hypothetical protein
MKQKLITLLFVLFSFFGVSQIDNTLHQQVCVLTNIDLVKEKYYVVVDFIEEFDSDLNEINNIHVLTNFEINSNSKLYTLNCSQIDLKTFVSSKFYIIKTSFLCSTYNNSLIEFTPINCVGE